MKAWFLDTATELELNNPYSPAKTIKAHILLPKGKDCKELLVNGNKKDFEIEHIESSLYVNFEILAEKKMSFEIVFN